MQPASAAAVPGKEHIMEKAEFMMARRAALVQNIDLYALNDCAVVDW
jgi:hypothetical protein